LTDWLTVEEDKAHGGHESTARLRVDRINGIRDWAGWRYVLLVGGDTIKTGEPMWEIEQRIDRARGILRESTIPPIPDRP
jgi:hypothetical protein